MSTTTEHGVTTGTTGDAVVAAYSQPAIVLTVNLPLQCDFWFSEPFAPCRCEAKPEWALQLAGYKRDVIACTPHLTLLIPTDADHIGLFRLTAAEIARGRVLGDDRD